MSSAVTIVPEARSLFLDIHKTEYFTCALQWERQEHSNLILQSHGRHELYLLSSAKFCFGTMLPMVFIKAGGGNKGDSVWFSHTYLQNVILSSLNAFFVGTSLKKLLQYFLIRDNNYIV